MPRKTKSPKSTCDLCCDNIESEQDQLACEGGCGCIVHRYCAGVTTKHYAELTASSTPFVCFYCSLSLFKTMVNQLQLQVDTLRGELDETKSVLKQKERIAATTEACACGTPPATYAAVTAHAARNSNRRQGKQKRVSKEQNKTNKNELLTATKAVTGPPALANQSETTTGGESVDYVVSSNVSKPKQFEKVSGARKVWGTLRETTVKAVTGVISKLCPSTIEFKIKRKTQTGNHYHGHKPRWWFVIHAKEEDLATLESAWSAVFDHTQWKLRPCYKPIFDLSTEPNDSVPNDLTQISQMSSTANSTNRLTASSVVPNENPPFLGVTPGEATTPP